MKYHPHRLMCKLAIFTLLLLLAAPAGADSIGVVVSVPPQLWLVESIGGERVEASALVGPGDSPATFQPTDVQVSRLMSARLYFRIGVPFERGPWFRAVASSRALEVIDLRQTGAGGSESHHSGEDPHSWLSPRRLAEQAEAVAAALIRSDPAHRAEYEAGARSTLEQLEQLDQELGELLAPYAGRSFFVFHPSWGYFAEDYGLRQVAIEVEGKEPSDRELTQLQVAARREGVRTVFVQPQIRGRSARAIADAIGAELRQLDPLARDVPANLRKVAAELVESFER